LCTYSGNIAPSFFISRHESQEWNEIRNRTLTSLYGEYPSPWEDAYPVKTSWINFHSSIHIAPTMRYGGSYMNTRHQPPYFVPLASSSPDTQKIWYMHSKRNHRCPVTMKMSERRRQSNYSEERLQSHGMLDEFAVAECLSGMADDSHVCSQNSSSTTAPYLTQANTEVCVFHFPEGMKPSGPRRGQSSHESRKPLI
ncbi:hypothetical protein KCU73_g9, partial [Aureobasidium melanogenum]